MHHILFSKLFQLSSFHVDVHEYASFLDCYMVSYRMDVPYLIYPYWRINFLDCLTIKNNKISFYIPILWEVLLKKLFINIAVRPKNTYILKHIIQLTFQEIKMYTLTTSAQRTQFPQMLANKDYHQFFLLYNHLENKLYFVLYTDIKHFLICLLTNFLLVKWP